MISSCLKWAAVAASTVMPLIILNAQAAQAAKFNFLIGYEDQPEPGSLSFDDSPLTGKGRESVKLSQLSNFVFSYLYRSEFAQGYYNDRTYLGEYRSYPDESPNAEFVFDNGDLVGIYYSGGISSSVDDTFLGSKGNGGSKYLKGSISLKFIGNSVEELFTGLRSIRGYNDETNEEYVDENYGTFTIQLPITFETVVPLKPIPEPFTILGTGTAILAGTFFKRKIAQKSNELKR